MMGRLALPADDDRHRAVAAHGDQKESPILQVWCIVDGQQNTEARDCNAEWDKGEGEAVLQQVRKGCDDHGEDEGACPWRHAVQLGLDLAVAIGSDDPRCEECVAASRSAIKFRSTFQRFCLPVSWDYKAKIHLRGKMSATLIK